MTEYCQYCLAEITDRCIKPRCRFKDTLHDLDGVAVAIRQKRHPEENKRNAYGILTSVRITDGGEVFLITFEVKPVMYRQPLRVAREVHDGDYFRSALTLEVSEDQLGKDLAEDDGFVGRLLGVEWITDPKGEAPIDLRILRTSERRDLAKGLFRQIKAITELASAVDQYNDLVIPSHD
jgi:hypothetical protein